ncbi:thioredoxin-disulfide reductase [Halanaerobium congolense]|jgi:thioredoxin reductase (NADPH)|uniref:Thioredoxin reductase n=1 Tax=Halanaerobium congolense TaxID=54121 RepID=A0A1G6PQ81_9FIRM|nr:thioredoxin-disulfide reductase [Halanaerobium congolense]KXS48178.1 MAG: thioredoxin reductase (NADPH) [Halanaerobium sp. T82-1]PUU87196.1 MAG: thioredoxin reductase (NADPH) [Halanaerobium sp.]PTX17374.1 thioredoxin reductase (NADPH) [Halanaerobium congolense]TDP26756.1 thioredoxin reductase (NADPH) [Halanaerobium congolense]SDC82370.1 thioredoxin reductase (NADPH) [Halanaerobium congolense]
MSTKYDLIIIGGGPAGIAAAIYGSRSRLKTLVLEAKRKTGGQPETYHDMENYPGVPETTAPELMDNFRTHAEKFNTEFERGEVTNIEINGLEKIIKCKKDKEYKTKSVIIATGAEPRRLGIKGEEEFKGKGVSYCATCDAELFTDLDIIVVGNGNSAVEESIYLTKFVNKLTMVVIHDEGVMDAEKILQEKAMENEKIDFVWNSVLEEIKGDGLVEKAVVKNIKNGEKSEIDCSGVFFFVGRVPSTDFLEGVVDLTEHGYVETTKQMETDQPGVYAVGDVRNKVVRQVITAAGDGATAAVMAQGYIEEEEYWEKNVVNSDKPAVVVFWSVTDQKSMNIVSKLENMELEDKGYKFLKIDTYKNRLISNRYDIEEIPTVLKLKDGQVAERLVDPAEKELKKIF